MTLPLSAPELPTLLVLATFLILLVAHRLARRPFATRAPGDWTIDLAGLAVQGAVIPLVGTAALLGVCLAVAPALRACVSLSALPAFLASFVLVDYLYYWNHRLLHTAAFWPVHAVHHTPDRLDVLVTSRNTLWSPLFILYLWVYALAAFLLRDPYPFLLGSALTAALDLWRHSGSPANAAPPCAAERLAAILISPTDHAWHHSTERPNVNFGANFAIWDRLHGTFHRPREYPPALGIETGLAPWRRLIFPFGRRSA